MPDSAEQALAHAVENARLQTLSALREALRNAPVRVLGRLAVDLVPELFRAGYTGEAGASGARWANAFARPRVTALPTFLVRIHSGPFSTDDAANLRMTMEGAGIAQAALALIADVPIPAALRTSLGTLVPWLLDTDGLAHLMVNANVGVTTRVYETKLVNPAYFSGASE
jgi:hypothetical protein